MPVLRLDTTQMQDYQRQLAMVGRAAMPVAVRQTLNAAAFDVKGVTMPHESNVMVHRKPTFFKANSGVTTAQGLDISGMVAQVGFNAKTGDKSHSVEDLEEQEAGGEIPDRSFVALAAARTGGWNTMVKTRNALKNIRETLVDPNDNRRGKTKSGFVASAILAMSSGGFMLNTWHNRVLKVKSITGDNGDLKVNYDVLYKIKKHGKAKVKALNFMEKASIESAVKMEKDFIKFKDIQLAKIK